MTAYGQINASTDILKNSLYARARHMPFVAIMTQGDDANASTSHVPFLLNGLVNRATIANVRMSYIIKGMCE